MNEIERSATGAIRKPERIDMIAAGMSVRKTLREIGAEIGLSGERVRQIAKDLGLKPPPKEPRAERAPRKRGRPPGACHAARLECKAAGLPDPYNRYVAHRKQADRRGIEFRMTFDEWWGLWQQHYANRGTKKGQMVMARHLDAGAYEVGNVTIKTVLENAQERSLSTNLRRVRWKKNSYGTSRFVPLHDDEDVSEFGLGELRPEYS